ncbi:MAG: hypothetical protein D6823_13905 [Chloroflexi bacterium]|nr:MAG: hypothetical protein D6823_13905 [Chloroflexota bacterium]
MSIGNNWRVLIKRWLVPASTAVLLEIIGRIPEDARVYRLLSKPASADSSGAEPGTPAQAKTISSKEGILVCHYTGEYERVSFTGTGTERVTCVSRTIADYIIDEDVACGLVHTNTRSIDFIPWDSILEISLSSS